MRIDVRRTEFAMRAAEGVVHQVPMEAECVLPLQNEDVKRNFVGMPDPLYTLRKLIHPVNAVVQVRTGSGA